MTARGQHDSGGAIGRGGKSRGEERSGLGAIAIVGAGPVGLAALLTAQFYSPAAIISIDHDDNRLQVAKSFGA